MSFVAGVPVPSLGFPYCDVREILGHKAREKRAKDCTELLHMKWYIKGMWSLWSNRSPYLVLHTITVYLKIDAILDLMEHDRMLTLQR